MTTSEHLQRIKAKCEQDILGYVACENILTETGKRAAAGLRTTIAAIDVNVGRAHWIAPCEDWPNGRPDNASAATLDAILAAWPEEIL